MIDAHEELGNDNHHLHILSVASVTRVKCHYASMKTSPKNSKITVAKADTQLQTSSRSSAPQRVQHQSSDGCAQEVEEEKKDDQLYKKYFRRAAIDPTVQRYSHAKSGLSKTRLSKVWVVKGWLSSLRCRQHRHHQCIVVATRGEHVWPSGRSILP